MWTWCIAAAAVLSGCGSQTNPGASAASPTITATEVKSEPGVIELSSAKATQAENNLVKFEIQYKFTSGAPVKNYLLEISFPGTSNVGRKTMEHWELKPEGVIKTSVELLEPMAGKFVIVMSEADSPDRGYKRNSNQLTGEIELLPEKSPST
jgi:hypothetical protein